MTKKSKGCYGYYSYHKKLDLIITLICFAVSFLIYFFCLWYFKTNQNFGTILAVLGFLPAAKNAIRCIMFFRTREGSEEEMEQIEKACNHSDLVCGYDYYVTSEKKNFDLMHVTVRGNVLVCFSLQEKLDEKAFVSHVDNLLSQNGYNDRSIKVFYDLDKYIDRISQLKELPAGNKDGEVLHLMGNISL
ncbi:MAG: hypothetical protein K5682_09845 [Lachnospiraceae bacterium]|nr:hypothetical protein [Lachnospiraceae bacterium]